MDEQQHESVDALLRQLTEPDAERRNQAALALAALHERRAVEPLIAALHDRSKYVRAIAAWALGQLQDPTAFDALLLANYYPYLFESEQNGLTRRQTPRKEVQARRR